MFSVLFKVYQFWLVFSVLSGFSVLVGVFSFVRFISLACLPKRNSVTVNFRIHHSVKLKIRKPKFLLNIVLYSDSYNSISITVT